LGLGAASATFAQGSNVTAFNPYSGVGLPGGPAPQYGPQAAYPIVDTVGPAGAGKSHTVSALAAAWNERTGGRVLGLATSQIATQNLAGLGLAAVNTSRFLAAFQPDENGQARQRLGAGDLLVVDEAGMSSTRELHAIATLAAAAGAKVVFTGDHAQLDAVEAGGMFAHLAETVGAHELTVVHRFTAPWEREASLQSLRRVNVKMAGAESPVDSLSGGNQQKMLLARLLMVQPEIVILNDPTRGVDVGSKQEIYQIIYQLAREGVSIIMTSSEIPEVTALADRVIVMSKGHKIAELSDAEVTTDNVLALVTQAAAADEHG